jgi:fatty acid desaturase
VYKATKKQCIQSACRFWRRDEATKEVVQMKFIKIFAISLVCLFILFGGWALLDLKDHGFVAIAVLAFIIAVVALIFVEQVEKLEQLEKRVKELEEKE